MEVKYIDKAWFIVDDNGYKLKGIGGFIDPVSAEIVMNEIVLEKYWEEFINAIMYN